MRLENFFEKDEIIEAYLNIVPYGRDASGQNVAGIQTAAKGIFGADVDELTIPQAAFLAGIDRKSTRLNSSHVAISYAVFCLKKKTRTKENSHTTTA